MTVPNHNTQYGDAVLLLTDGNVLEVQKAFSYMNHLLYFVGDKPAGMHFDAITEILTNKIEIEA